MLGLRELTKRLEVIVSIHAPTRGATIAFMRHYNGTISFNPRSHAGSDCCSLSFCRFFQRFNPRSHAGSDCVRRACLPYWWVSIHAPTRGATTSRTQVGHNQFVLIHAPTRGATPAAEKVASDKQVSIHAPTRGATPSCISPRNFCGRFNPRSHAGSDDGR